jgi:RsmE family RNA methyltransferase
LTDHRARHLLGVLGVGPEQTVRVGLVDGPCGVATVAACGNGVVDLRCAFEVTPPPRPPVDLLLALPRPKVLQRLLPQLAALGVARIMLTNAERVERNYFDTHVLSPDVYRPLLIEGLQQARDTLLPAISVHRQFRVLIEDHLDGLCPVPTRIVTDPAAVTPLTAVAARAADRVLVAVGPEGGWNAFEMALMNQHGFSSAGLGGRTLRSDTACIAILAMVHAALGR